MLLEVAEMKFSAKLRELMSLAGMNDSKGEPDVMKLHKATGVPYNTLKGYVFGTRNNPSGRYILLLARGLKVQTDTFMDCLDDLGIKGKAKRKK